LEPKKQPDKPWRHVLSQHTTNQPKVGKEDVNPLSSIKACSTSERLANGDWRFRIDGPNAFRRGDGLKWSAHAESPSSALACEAACFRAVALLLLMGPQNVRLLHKDWHQNNATQIVFEAQRRAGECLNLVDPQQGASSQARPEQATTFYGPAAGGSTGAGRPLVAAISPMSRKGAPVPTMNHQPVAKRPRGRRRFTHLLKKFSGGMSGTASEPTPVSSGGVSGIMAPAWIAFFHRGVSAHGWTTTQPFKPWTSQTLNNGK